MAIYLFYDTEGTIVVSGIDTDANALWGSAAAVRWFSIAPDQIARLNNNDMLEITVKNVSLILGTQWSFVIRNFTVAELQKRITVITNPSKESIALRVVKEGNGAKFVFKIHAQTIKSITRNLSTGLTLTLGVKDGKISLVMKQIPGLMLAGDDIITTPSGGAKIP